MLTALLLSELELPKEFNWDVIYSIARLGPDSTSSESTMSEDRSSPHGSVTPLLPLDNRKVSIE